jgi:hypothetical protein
MAISLLNSQLTFVSQTTSVTHQIPDKNLKPDVCPELANTGKPKTYTLSSSERSDGITFTALNQ